MRPGTRAGDDAGLQAGRFQPAHDALEIFRALLDRGLALAEALDVLVSAAIELHAGIFERLQRHDLPRELDHGLGAGHARAMHAGIDIDDHLERFAGPGGRGGERLDIGRMIDHDHQVGHLAIELDQTRDGLRRHHRRGDVQPLDAGLGQRLGLAQLGATVAERPGGDLPFGDVGRLVRLGMRPQVHLVRLGEIRHLGDVAIERLDVDHERRRVEAEARALLADEMAVKAFGVAHVSYPWCRDCARSSLRRSSRD